MKTFLLCWFSLNVLLLVADASFFFPEDFAHIKANRVDDPNCPYQPFPVDLGEQIPEELKEAFKNMTGTVQSLVNNVSLPGISVSVNYRGKTLFYLGAGTTDKIGGVIPTANTIFRIGSISKVFVAIAVYQLYQNGLIASLDDPFTKYVPDFKINHVYSNSNITIKSLLSQMSGLPRETPCGIFPGSLNVCPVNSATILKHLSTMSTIRPVYNKPSYSNLAFSLLGRLLVEKFYPGMTYEQYVQQYILTPLNMTKTGFNITSDIQKEMAVGYMPDGSKAILYDLGWNSPCGQMYSTTSDLDKLAAFFIDAFHFEYLPQAGKYPSNYDSVLTRELRKTMSQPVFWNADGLTQFGTPFEIRTQLNYFILRKGGNVDGYSALFAFIPNLRLGLNMLFSGSFDEFSGGSDIYNIIIPGFVNALKLLGPPIPIPPSFNPYIGEYVDSSGTIHISVQQDPYSKELLVLKLPISFNTYLVYYKEGVMAMWSPSSLAPCIVEELLGLTGEWVMFSKMKDNVYTVVNAPGFLYGIDFTRK